MENIKEIVESVVAELLSQNLIRVSSTSVFQKTEKLLYIYEDIEEVNEPLVRTLNNALEKLRGDPDFDIIELKYFEKRSHEEIAEVLDVDPRTITRRKNRIIKRLSFMLFPSEAINELCK